MPGHSTGTEPSVTAFGLLPWACSAVRVLGEGGLVDQAFLVRAS